MYGLTPAVEIVEKFNYIPVNKSLMGESTAPSEKRVASIDITRGSVMLIMALDHVRDFFHGTAMIEDPLNLATTTYALFFTRWITHLCAPVFVILSGCSAFLAGRHRSPKQLSKFLILRGIWLILVEFAVITFGWTFDPEYSLLIAQVIWAIGFSMIVLGLLVLTSYRTVVVIGISIFFLHNLLDYISFAPGSEVSLIMNLFLITRERVFPINENHQIFLLYAALPWTGIMLLGYGFGCLFSGRYSYLKRKNLLLLSGSIAIVLFIILRAINEYGDPSGWSQQKNFWLSFLAFINVTKYPPSLLYSLITLGLSFIILAFMEGRHNRFTRILEVYGRVPFFYYVLHVFLIHILTVLAFYSSGYTDKDIVDPNTIFHFRPLTFGYSLPIVYLIWIFVIFILYFPCRWFCNYRKRHKQWWLSFL